MSFFQGANAAGDFQDLAKLATGVTSFAVSRRNAAELRKRAAAEAAQARREGAAIIAQARAKRGASGLQVGTGTSLDVTLALAEALEMRALRTAYPLLAEASARETEGALDLITSGIGTLSSRLGRSLRQRQIQMGPSGTAPATRKKLGTP